MPRAAILVASAVAATVVMVGGGVVALGRDDDEPTPATGVVRDDAAVGVRHHRRGGRPGPFCDGIDDRQVSAALDGDPADSSSWENGDTIDLGNGVEDVAHEFGCRYTAEDGTIAQAWVFAPAGRRRRRSAWSRPRQGGRAARSAPDRRSAPRPWR